MTDLDDGLKQIAWSLKLNNLGDCENPASLQEGLPTLTDCGSW